MDEASPEHAPKVGFTVGETVYFVSGDGMYLNGDWTIKNGSVEDATHQAQNWSPYILIEVDGLVISRHPQRLFNLDDVNKMVFPNAANPPALHEADVEMFLQSSMQREELVARMGAVTIDRLIDFYVTVWKDYR